METAAIALDLTFEERRLVLERLYPGGAVARRLRLALVSPERVLRVRATGPEVEELLTFLAHEAARAADRELSERLGGLYDRLREEETRREARG